MSGSQIKPPALPEVHDFERALSEINKAIAIEPNAPRYIGIKGQVYARIGEISGRDQEIETGIRYLKRAQEAHERSPDASSKPGGYNFVLAFSLSALSRPRWDEVITHYQRHIESGSNDSLAFAWNNLSIAYRHARECRKSLHAAEAALRIADFGAARQNKRAAEFCLEMTKLGMITGLPATKR